ncbi:hypothetical protein [Rhodospira trueperi]|uniref:hypothetical protein n=1 Tax=Rhodospira trueperi TaxID=69960 RepID=UPI000B86223B|nr:hypothetical protein [Rhodospira trueperi]
MSADVAAILAAAILAAAHAGLAAGGVSLSRRAAPRDVDAVRAWINAGATPSLVRLVGRLVAHRVAHAGLEAPRSLVYLDRAVREALAGSDGTPDDGDRLASLIDAAMDGLTRGGARSAARAGGRGARPRMAPERRHAPHDDGRAVPLDMRRRVLTTTDRGRALSVD